VGILPDNLAILVSGKIKRIDDDVSLILITVTTSYLLLMCCKSL